VILLIGKIVATLATLATFATLAEKNFSKPATTFATFGDISEADEL
jgi:hypothetical protein